MEQLLQGLSNSDAYPHPVLGQVEIVHTYTSVILLTGEYAYKIKKPVDFGFLNYTTLDARKHYCTQEHLLNQSLAKEIYDSVIPIYKNTDTGVISLSAPGEIIEYALKMKQFPKNQLLSDVIEQHANDFVLIDQLAEKIAFFHQTTERAAANSNFGTPEAIYAPVEENFQQARALLQSADDLKQLDTLESQTQTLFEHLKPLIAARKARHLPRACHGDLHLGNITLINGEPLIFDCIEFNENFRWLDPMADIGFLMMDFQHNNYPQLANYFINAYLEMTGDYEGLKLLNFFIAYRAMVRAKIQLFQQNKNLSPEANEQLLNNYRQYVTLALDSLKVNPLNCIVMNGVSGSGKSTTALKMVETFQMIRLRSDVERKRITTARNTETLYSTAAHHDTYRRLHDLAEICLQAGYSPIIDATNLYKQQRGRFHTLAKQYHANYLIVSCDADPAFIDFALQQRAADSKNISDATPDVIHQQLQHREKLSAEELPHAIILKMQQNLNFNSYKAQIKNLLC